MGGGWLTIFEVEMGKDKAYEIEKNTQKAKHTKTFFLLTPSRLFWCLTQLRTKINSCRSVHAWTTNPVR